MKTLLRSLCLQLSASQSRRDFWALLVDRGLRLAVGMILSGLTGRYLGTVAFGWLNYASAIMMLSAAISHLGMDSIVVREVAKRPGEASEIVGAAFLARIVAGCVLAIGIWLMADALGKRAAPQVELIAILALGSLVPALGVPALWFQARTESRVAVRWGLVSFLLSAGARLAAIVGQAPVAAFAWIALAEAACGFGLTYVAMKKHGGSFSFRESHAMAARMLRESWPLLIGALAASLALRIDQIMLNWLVGADAVGVYVAGTRLSDAAYSLPLLLGASVMATLSLASTQKDGFDALVERYFRASAALGYALAIPAILLAPWLLHALYGRGFNGAGDVARLHLVSVIFVAIGVARGRVLVVQGLTRFAMVTALCGCAVNIALNFVLIPLWGAMGAALSSVIGQAAATVGSTFLSSRTRALGCVQLRALVRPAILLNEK